MCGEEKLDVERATVNSDGRSDDEALISKRNSYYALGRNGRKIKILYIIDWLYGFGGTEKHLLQLVHNIDRQKFKCYLLAFQKEPDTLKHFENSSCHILPFSLNKIYNLRAFHTAVHLIRFLKKEEIDIVHTFHFGADTFGAIISRFARVPLIISDRRDLGSYRTGHYRIADQVTKRLIHRFLSVCDRVSKSMVHEGIPKNKITRIYNGIDLSEWPECDGRYNGNARKKLNIDKKSFVIGNISHFRPEKGHKIFFEVVKRLVPQIPNLKVLALGGAHMFEYFKTFIQKDEILNKIVTVEHVKDVKDYISVMDIACLTPIKNEGFSNAILEEMAAGKPVIATDVGGNAEAVANGETGYVIPPNDTDALEQAILKSYHNPDLRLQMGSNGRNRVKSTFTLEEMIKSVEKYYLKNLEEVRR